jgi:head-tail adaptor
MDRDGEARERAGCARHAVGDVHTVGTMRCDMRDQSATEQEYADGVSVLKQYEVRVRWLNIGRLSVVATDRLEVRGKTLRINHIRNLDEDDRVAVIECTEVT